MWNIYNNDVGSCACANTLTDGCLLWNLQIINLRKGSQYFIDHVYSKWTDHQ